MEKKLYYWLLIAQVVLGSASCETAEEVFVGDRLAKLCDESYWVCNVSTGCVLDNDHYVEGVFPGTRRIVITTQEVEQDIRVRIYFRTQESPGTEILVQLYEPNCIVNTALARENLVNVDLFEEAGDDRMLIFELTALEEGEHLLEIYSDASAEYLLVVEPI